MININDCYDKAGELFSKVETALMTNNVSFTLVNQWLYEFELVCASTAKICNYVIESDIVHILKFTGIKYSPVTDIFYTMKDEKLYKFPAYKRNLNAQWKDDGKMGSEVTYVTESIAWEESEYKDINGMSITWVDATDNQIAKFELIDKFASDICEVPEYSEQKVA